MKQVEAMHSSSNPNDTKEPAQVVISGAGIVGLVLALALKKQLGIQAELYEKAHAFQDDVGAALGMYPNAMRVIRDIDPKLLRAIKEQGKAYCERRWERHDGTKIASASERVLSGGDRDLDSIGIRRWRLQKVLQTFAQDANIPIYFSKATSDIVERDDGLIEVVFADGTSRLTNILFGADGGKSMVRQIVADPEVQLHYTGVTCLMGISEGRVRQRGICFPSSTTTECHAVYFPTGENEQCFQIHWPLPESDANQENWGNMDHEVGRRECAKLAKKLRADGWHPKFLEPLQHVTNAVKVGFCLLEPRLEHWVYGKTRRIVLLGDAAHPPVPYVGQGAQMGIEDAGTLSMLIRRFCVDTDGVLDWSDFGKAMTIYEKIRIPRTSKVLEGSKKLGRMQEKRSCEDSAGLQELLIQGEVMMNETLPVMFQGASYNYRQEVDEGIRLQESEWLEEQYKREDIDTFDKLMQEGEMIMNEAMFRMGAI